MSSGDASSDNSGHKTILPKLKKQNTYSGLIDQTDCLVNGGADRETQHGTHAQSINRTNSFCITEESTGQSLNSINHHGNENNGNTDSENNANTGQKPCFHLHRCDEIENLADSDLLLTDDMGKSHQELFTSKAHLKRTLELEHLDEINKD